MKLITFIVGLGPGGAEKYLSKLIEASSSEIKHTVVYLTNPYYLTNFKNLCSTMNIFEYLRSQMVRNLFSRDKNQIIYQGWMYHGMLIASLFHLLSKGSKLIWCFRHASPIANKKRTIFLIKILSFLSFYIKPILIFNSNSGKENHKKLFPKYLKKIVIFNGYHDKKKGVKSRVNNLKLKLLSLNRWHPDKDLNLMIKSLKILKENKIDFSLDMYGDKINYKNIELVDIINNLGLKENIKLCGLKKNIDKIIPKYDYHLLSSCADTFPNVICETMLLGIPNIVTDVGDCKEIVNENGWISPPSDINLFAESIINANAIKGTQKYKKLSKNCIQNILDNYSFSNSLNEFKKIWIS